MRKEEQHKGPRRLGLAISYTEGFLGNIKTSNHSHPEREARKSILCTGGRIRRVTLYPLVNTLRYISQRFLRTWKMMAKQYLKIIPPLLGNTDMTEAWGNRKLNDLVLEQIPLDNDKILWGKANRPLPRENSLDRGNRSTIQSQEEEELNEKEVCELHLAIRRKGVEN